MKSAGRITSAMIRAWYSDRPDVLRQLREERVAREARPARPAPTPAQQSDRAELIVELQVRTVSEANSRGWHGKMKRAAEQRWLTWLHLSRLELPRLPAAVRLVRLRPPRGRPLDSDNLASALKAIRDGVADAYGVDDASPLYRWSVEQQPVPPGRGLYYAVRVVISRLDSDC